MATHHQDLIPDFATLSKKNGRRRLTLPRPRLVNVIELVESIERAGPKERRKALPRFDEDLAKAASKDMAAYVGEVMSSVSFRPNAPGANGIRTRQVFSRFGWCEVRHPYRVGSPEESDVFKAFGVGRKTTPSASKAATRLAVTQGSSREAKGTLALLGCGNISVSKPRKETLRAGESALAGLRKPGKDVRKHPAAKLRTPDGARRVPRTLVVMADGTNPPCTKADTAGARGKDSAQAKSKDALNYLDKRRGNMRYGWLRKHGCYISSCHMEAAARILVARRCKQAGMHWRHHNAACVCAIIARLRSAASRPTPPALDRTVPRRRQNVESRRLRCPWHQEGDLIGRPHRLRHCSRCRAFRHPRSGILPPSGHESAP